MPGIEDQVVQEERVDDGSDAGDEVGYPADGYDRREQSDVRSYHPTDGKWYGECHQCCFGGPADTTNPFHWPVAPNMVIRTPTRNGGVSYRLAEKARCPKCQGSDVGVFIPRGRILEQMRHSEMLRRNEELEAQNEALMRRLEEAGKAAPAKETKKDKKPPLRGQYDAK